MMTTRDKVLTCLKERQGEWISGETMRRMLNISRSAVSKHIKILRDRGYEIESSTNRGYVLKDSDVFSLQEIHELLNSKRFSFDRMVYLKETDSTNIQARKLAQQQAVEGTVVIADSQISGKGRRRRSWFSEPNSGIYASIILRPNIEPVNAPVITLICSVSIAKALIEMTGADVRIKWPNDLLINGKKVAGILTEIMTEPDFIDHIIIGIGVNVNTLKFPDDISNIATSLFIETGKIQKRSIILAGVLNQFEKHYDQFLQNEIKPIMDEWRSLCEILGQSVRVDLFSGSIRGIAKAVTDEGILIVEDESGNIHRVVSGDVHHLRTAK